MARFVGATKTILYELIALNTRNNGNIRKYKLDITYENIRDTCI